MDTERKLRLKKLNAEQITDNDIESWAESYAKGEIALTTVPSDIRTRVQVRSETIREKLEEEAEQEYKDQITLRLEHKQTDFETERALALADQNLNVSEQRSILDFIDGLEQNEKEMKAAKKKGTPFIPGLSPPLLIDPRSAPRA